MRQRSLLAGFGSLMLAAVFGFPQGLDGVEDFGKIAGRGFQEVVNGHFPDLVNNPLGSPHNSYPWSMAWFNGRLYVGTVRDVLCFHRTGEDSDVTDCPNLETGIPGTEQRGEIWRYTPGGLHGLDGAWERVYRSPNVSFGIGFFVPRDTPRDIGYRNMVVSNVGDGVSRLYTTTLGIPGNVLYYNGSSFVAASQSGLRNSSLDLAQGAVDLGYRAMTEFKGRLWIAPCGLPTDPDVTDYPVVYANSNPAGGGAWQVMVNTKTYPTLGDAGNLGVFQMQAMGDYLFLGVTNRTTGFELWRGDGSGCSLPPGPCNMTWEKIIDSGAGRPPDSQGPDIDNAMAVFGVHEGDLYVSTGESAFNQTTYAELLRVNSATGRWGLLVGAPRPGYATNPLLGNFDCAAGRDVGGTCYATTLRGPGFGNPATPPTVRTGTARYIWRMTSYDGYLYAGTLDTGRSSGFDLWRSPDGIAWTVVNSGGFGNPKNYGIRTLLPVPNLGLVVGVANPYTDDPTGGAQVWVGSTHPALAQAPVALAGPDLVYYDDENSPNPGDFKVAATLDGRPSYDPFGGQIIQWEWYNGPIDCNSPPSSPVATTAFYKPVLDTGDEATDYEFVLRVRDNEGNCSCDSAKVSARHNLPPTAAIETDPPLVTSQRGWQIRLVDFDGDGKERFLVMGSGADPEGRPVTLKWDDPPEGLTLENPDSAHTYAQAEVLGEGGTRHTLSLTVTDDVGNKVSTSIQVNVEEVIDDPSTNERPECRCTSLTTTRNVPLVLDPTDPDNRICQDPEGSSITYVIDSQPASGTAEGGVTITYTPQLDFIGLDYFTFHAVDAEGESNREIGVLVTVQPPDETAPTSTISFPTSGAYDYFTFKAGGNPDIFDVCGTSADSGSGVQRVELSIQKDGAYWDGAAFSSGTELFLTASGTNNWTYAFQPPATGTYVIHARGVDQAGNAETSPVVTFTYTAPAPPGPPSIPALLPGSDSGSSNSDGITGDNTPTFTGTADPGTVVTLYSGANAIGAGSADGSGNWVITSSTLANGTHSVSAVASGPGGSTPGVGSLQIQVDAVAPTIAITFPLNGLTYSPASYSGGGGAIKGSAADSGAGLSTVQVSIRRSSDNSYWTGSSFNTFTERLLPVSGGALWSYNFVPPLNGAYMVRAYAADVAGNNAVVSSQFTYSENKHIRVADIDGTVTSSSIYAWTVTFAIKIVDQGGNPVAGANVTVAANYSVKRGVTDSGGIYRFSQTFWTSPVRLNVTNVSISGATYRPDLNSDPDGDSNGTSLLLYRPR